MASQSELLQKFSEYAERAGACQQALENAQETLNVATNTVREEVQSIKETITETVATTITEAMESEDNAYAFTGATEDSDGSSGMVPAATKADVNSVLMGDGQWHDPTDVIVKAKSAIICMDEEPETVPDNLADGGIIIVRGTTHASTENENNSGNGTSGSATTVYGVTTETMETEEGEW